MGIKKGAAQHFLRVTAPSFEGDDCLIWPYAKDRKGYGVASIPGQSRYVHRYVCRVVHGSPPDEKYEAAHGCGNGHIGCCNPRHLRWATRQENKDDELIHGSRNRGVRQGHSILTDDDVIIIKQMKGVETQKNLGLRFGVGARAIGEIHRGANWYWLQAGNDNSPERMAA